MRQGSELYRVSCHSNENLSGLDIVTVATNEYLHMVHKQICLFAEQRELGGAKKAGNPTWIVLTNVNDPEKAFNWPQSVRIKFAKVLDFDWPEVTLFRYREILRNSTLFGGHSLIWLDSDMRIHALPKFPKADKSLYFAPHPGFNFNLSYSKRSFYRTARMFLGKIVEGRLSRIRVGDWEDNRDSLSFVPPNHRKPYVHGAFWGGTKSEVLNMCKSLALRTDIDYARGLIARYHDESHLNWYFSVVGGELFPNSASYWVQNSSLQRDKAFVESLDKSLGLEGMWKS